MYNLYILIMQKVIALKLCISNLNPAGHLCLNFQTKIFKTFIGIYNGLERLDVSTPHQVHQVLQI